MTETFADASPYISVSELQALQPDPRLVLLDARISRSQRPDGTVLYSSGLKSFREDGHIPGAIFADLFEAFSDAGAPFPFTRPTAENLPPILRDHGVDNDSRIVVYDSLNGVWAARLWWVLTTAGLPAVQLLNGGLAVWTAQGGPLALGDSPPRASKQIPTLAPHPDLFVDLPDVLSIVQGQQPAALVCALRETDFNAGHLPGSRLLPYASILSADGQVDPHLAGQAAHDLQIGKDEQLVLYCGGGVNAAGLGIALLAAGYANVSVYDGSLSEWKADPARPLLRGPATP